MMCRWLPNGSNNMVGEPVCKMPDAIIGSALYDSQKDVYLFNSMAYNEWGQYTRIWKFDGNSFTELTIEVPDEFFNNDLIETNAYWYAGGYKMAKSDYAVTSFNISNDYQILDIVGNPEGSDLSFTAIRYSDAKKVIGKIKPDDTVVIESVQSTSQDIYNLIPPQLNNSMVGVAKPARPTAWATSMSADPVLQHPRNHLAPGRA